MPARAPLGGSRRAPCPLTEGGSDCDGYALATGRRLLGGGQAAGPPAGATFEFAERPSYTGRGAFARSQIGGLVTFAPEVSRFFGIVVAIYPESRSVRRAPLSQKDSAIRAGEVVARGRRLGAKAPCNPFAKIRFTTATMRPPTFTHGTVATRWKSTSNPSLFWLGDLRRVPLGWSWSGRPRIKRS